VAHLGDTRAAALAPKPRSLDHTSASATPLSALTVWQALFDHARLAPGQRVLIHGATRGVGSFAVPLARWRGAHVIGTASPATVTSWSRARTEGCQGPVAETLAIRRNVWRRDGLLRPIRLRFGCVCDGAAAPTNGVTNGSATALESASHRAGVGKTRDGRTVTRSSRSPIPR
jgi:hypothetical protein